MEKRGLMLVLASAAAAIVMVGCSCANAVDNSVENTNQIMMQSNVTVSSGEVKTTTASARTTDVQTAETTISTTETSDATGTTTTVDISNVQFVGRPEGNRQTTKPKVVTQVVIVTVTRPRTTVSIPVITNPVTQAMATTTTTTESTTTTTTTAVIEEKPLYTAALPDGMFHSQQDVRFVQEGIDVAVGESLPTLGDLVLEVSEGTAENGGFFASIYKCEGYQLKTESFTLEDGSMQERIVGIVLTGARACTGKGIVAGDGIDKVTAAYGTENCEVTAENTYRYKTEDGRVLDFCTDGSVVTEIRYYHHTAE